MPTDSLVYLSRAIDSALDAVAVPALLLVGVALLMTAAAEIRAHARQRRQRAAGGISTARQTRLALDRSTSAAGVRRDKPRTASGSKRSVVARSTVVSTSYGATRGHDRSGRRCRLRRSRLPARGSPGAIRRDSWRPRGGSGREPTRRRPRGSREIAGRAERAKLPDCRGLLAGGSVSQRGAVASPSHPAAKALPPRDAWATHPAGRP